MAATCSAAQRPPWVLPATSLLATLGGGALAAWCWRLRRRHRHQVLVLHLLQLGVCDFLYGLINSFFSVRIVWLGFDHMSTLMCSIVVFVSKSVMMASVFLSLFMGLGLLLHLQRRPIPLWLWRSHWIVVLMAVLSCIGYLYTVSDETVAACSTPIMASTINAAEVAMVFLLMFGMNAVALCQAKAAPHSVIQRSLRHASLYMLAFFLSYSLHVVYHCWRFFFPDFADEKGCWYRNLQFYGQVLSQSNGLFNFLALSVHAWRMRRKNGPDAHVSFRSAASLQEVLEIPDDSKCPAAAPDAAIEEIGTWLLPTDSGTDLLAEQRCADQPHSDQTTFDHTNSSASDPPSGECA